MATNDLAQLETERVHKEQFYKALDAIEAEEMLKAENLRKNTRLYRKDQYMLMINEIEEANRISGKKTNRQYYLQKKYEVLLIGETKRIIPKRSSNEEEIKQLVPYERMFDVLLKCHLMIGHKGRDAMIIECSKQHLNVTVELITSKSIKVIN
jgi:hypothetical protein